MSSDQPQIWQVCGTCQGRGGKDEQTGFMIDDLTGQGRPPIVRTAVQWTPCSTCVGTGQVSGGVR
jgi:DnaJ-class molecular chaperone